MSKPLTARAPDYQLFDIAQCGLINIGPRMKAKMEAIPLPDLAGKSVLDVGCDHGFWTFLAAFRGADYVLGLDRNRPVRGEMFDLIASNRAVADQWPALKKCFFENINVGKQWTHWGGFDVVFLFSLYHHIFENCGDHEAIWLWLRQHCKASGAVLWENPVDVDDGVAHAHISKDKHHLYTREHILAAANKYFTAEYIGPALHEPTRHVYRFWPKIDAHLIAGKMEAGAGGAGKAFQYSENRRMKEIESIIGFEPFPGSLNIKLETTFDFGSGFFRADILDVVDRASGLDSFWKKRPCRFYPIKVGGWPAYAMRFEGETYPPDFLEVISSARLRDILPEENVVISRY